MEYLYSNLVELDQELSLASCSHKPE